MGTYRYAPGETLSTVPTKSGTWWVRRSRFGGQRELILSNRVERLLETNYSEPAEAMRNASAAVPVTTGFADYLPASPSEMVALPQIR